MKNIFGNYQVWKMYGNSLSKYIDSFNTQKEALEYIEQNYSLWKKPKWEIVADSRPIIKTKIKGDNVYDGICITVKSPNLRHIGDKVELTQQSLVIGSFGGNGFFGASKVSVFLTGKTGEIVDAKVKKDDYDALKIIYTVKFDLFGETLWFYKSESFKDYSGTSEYKITPIISEKALNV